MSELAGWTKSNHWHENTNQYEVSRSAKMARNYTCDNAVEIEVGLNYNGSGGKAFGGAKEWPHVKLSMPFVEGRFDLRDKFVAELQALVDRFIEENK